MRMWVARGANQLTRLNSETAHQYHFNMYMYVHTKLNWTVGNSGDDSTVYGTFENSGDDSTVTGHSRIPGMTRPSRDIREWATDPPARLM